VSSVNRYSIALRRIFLPTVTFLVFACSPIIPPGGQEEVPAQPVGTQASNSSTSEGNEIQMTPTLPTSTETNMQSLVEKARADLAQRLGISKDEINVVEANSVVWPDGSLGCPEQGMQYAQVLTPGYLIRLRYQEQQFEYHASRGTTIVYCEDPAPPVPGTPADT